MISNRKVKGLVLDSQIDFLKDIARSVCISQPFFSRCFMLRETLSCGGVVASGRTLLWSLDLASSKGK